MRNYKKNNNFKKDSHNKSKKFKYNKKFIFGFISIIFTGGVLFLPICLFRINNNYANRIGRLIYKSSNLLGPQYGSLADDVFYLGDNLFNTSYRYFKSVINKKDKLEINLNSKNYGKIQNLRNLAIKESSLVRTDGDKVKGSITYKEKTYPISLRLKGDFTDHLLGEKWSFRVETRKNRALLGMREFSLQHPRTRSYISEYLLHKFLEHEGLPFLRYKFIPVSLNGKYLGIYALEEHFGKELIENSKLIDGPILKISDQDLRNEWNRKYIKKDTTFQRLLPNEFLNTTENNAKILTFNTKKFSNDTNKLSQFQLGSKLLDEYLKKNLNSSDIFDLSMTAKYFAVIDLLQALGANTWQDMRFYFNPITARLIPIGYDAQIPYILERRNLSIDQNVLKIFDDQDFIREYTKELYRITKDDYFENFLKTISNDLSRELSVLNQSFPFISLKLLKDEVLQNKIYIRNRLLRLEPLGINSINILSKNKVELEIFNKNKLPINIEELIFNDEKYVLDSDQYLAGERGLKRVNIKKFSFNKVNSLPKKNKKEIINSMNSNSLQKDITINYKIDGIPVSRSLKTKIFEKVLTTDVSDPLITRIPTYKNFKKLVVEEERKEIVINQNMRINQPLILPIGYKLIVYPDVEIIIENKGLILVQGPLIINGEDTKKVLIKSENSGKGISVLNAQKNSYVKFATFENLRPNKDLSTIINGGITFFNSPVEIYNSHFINSPSEDALNLVRSPFLVQNSLFSNNESDAIDVDFSNGTIENSFFKKTGNDAIDISGSQVYLNKITIEEAGDKGISVGERGSVNANNLNISKVFIGIASKDFSTIQVNNIKVKKSNICFASYQKKPEYGPGLIKLTQSISECDLNYILEDGSSIISSGYNMLPNTKRAYEELYSE